MEDRPRADDTVTLTVIDEQARKPAGRFVDSPEALAVLAAFAALLLRRRDVA